MMGFRMCSSILLVLFSVLLAKSFAHRDAKKKSLEKLESSQITFEKCLASLGIGYNEPCNLESIEKTVNKFIKKDSNQEMKYDDEEEMGRIQCRSYPHISACENNKCVCTMFPKCDITNTAEVKPRPESCKAEYDEYNRQRQHHLKVLKENESHVGKAANSGNSLWISTPIISLTLTIIICNFIL